MKPETILNLYSEHRLQDCTIDFLEHLKINQFHILNPERFETINYVNNAPDVAKKIFESQYNSGFGASFKVKSKNDNPQFKNFEAINNQRESIRTFSDESLTLDCLSDFLHLFYRVTNEEGKQLNNGEKVVKKRRNIASGGGVYSAEIYVVNLKITELPKGIFYYNIHEGALELVKSIETEDDKAEFDKIIMNVGAYKSSIDYDHASAFVLFTSIINKHSFKYKDFGVALALMEIGELVHSAYLSASTIDIGCCAFGGFLNRNLHRFLDLKNSLHMPIICMAIGNKPE
jgi:SagB-type dehydrogenase family enzyme